MSTRCILRSLFLIALSLAVVAWPSISKADTVLAGGVFNWDSTGQPGIFDPSLQYPILSGTPTSAQLAAYPGAMSWGCCRCCGEYYPRAFCAHQSR